jgi:hypothetical protein
VKMREQAACSTSSGVSERERAVSDSDVYRSVGDIREDAMKGAFREGDPTRTPYLFRFSQRCLSPGRAIPDPRYVYDDALDMVVRRGSADSVPAVLADGGDGDGGPKTKKRDIEKGEDCKDRRMWQ